MTSGTLIGVDVGTGSVRAGVFDTSGVLLGHASRPISMWREPGGIVEQSSANIWAAVIGSVRDAVERCGVDPASVRGIGFDATCSLVVVGRSGEPLAVGPSGDPQRDVIVWMDHRAREHADRINALGHSVLDYVGGRISPEMQTPKLAWLSQNRPETFAAAGHFFDLPDFLTWRATGSTARSLCTLVCKWTYLGHERRWDEGYFRSIGLGALADEGFARIGTEISEIGAPVGQGLSVAAADELGLPVGTPVGTAMIDAHAGALGTLDQHPSRIAEQLALIAGTSACTMSVSGDAMFVPGVWGPYHGALLPGYWLNEGGISAFGAALDYFIASHPAADEALKRATEAGVSFPNWLEERALDRAGSVEAAALLASHLHVLPELLGNRSPFADPHATGMIAGMRLEPGIEGVVDLYVATLRGLSYGVADIVDAVVARGQPLSTMVISGGAGRSGLLRRILADATGLAVSLPPSPEPVLLGSAMLGAVAGGVHASLADASKAMVSGGTTLSPDAGAQKQHARFRDVYRALQACERSIRAAH